MGALLGLQGNIEGREGPPPLIANLGPPQFPYGNQPKITGEMLNNKHYVPPVTGEGKNVGPPTGL